MPLLLPPTDQQSLLTICNAHAHLYADTNHISTAQFWIRVATEFNRELGRTRDGGDRRRGRGRAKGRGRGNGGRAETPTPTPTELERNLKRKGPSLSGSAARSWVGYLVDGYYRERERGCGGRRRIVRDIGDRDAGGSEPTITTTRTTTTANNPPHQSRSPSIPRASEADPTSEATENQIASEHAPTTTTTTTTPLQQWIVTYERFGHLRGYVPPGRSGGGGPACVSPHGDGEGEGEGDGGVQLPQGVKMEISCRPRCRCHRGRGGRGVHYSLA